MRPKPTLGYPSRTEAVLALRARGFRQKEIAPMLKISHRTVSALECAARRRSSARQLSIPVNLWFDLQREAEARGTSIDQLVQSVLFLAVRDRLFDAILDSPQ